MILKLFHYATILVAVSAVLTAPFLFTPLPAVAAPHNDSHGKQPHCERVWITPEELHAQNLVFPGHDGHIMPPMPQDWAQYHAAQARAQAARPLFPWQPQDGSPRRMY